MLIRDEGATWTAIGQPAHAWLASQVARAWVPEPAPVVLLGIEQHDVVWSGWDRRPPLNADARRAVAFFEAPVADRLSLWRGAADHLLAQDPYAALLVALHARNIHTRLLDRSTLAEEHVAILDDLLAEQARTQGELIERVGARREQAERDADLLFCVDAVSLSLCLGWPGRDLPPVDGRTIRLEWLGPAEASLHPWPLAVDELDVSLSARRLADRFDDERSLHAALDAAPFTTLSWRLRRT